MDAEHDAVRLTRDLVRRASLSPDDAGCQSLIAERLCSKGFAVERLPFNETDNIWAVHGSGPPVVCFAGHTDVVPPGPCEKWRHDPFSAEIADGILYGRGAADMKASLAAFLVAGERFVDEEPHHRGSLALLLTSDEEGAAADGTARVVAVLKERGVRIDYCLVGEPTCTDRLGDTIKNGRRGSLSGRLTVRGKQGHVAYPHLARNPIHMSAPAIAALASLEWDKGNAYFPPTSWQVSSIQAGTGAGNVIPGELTLEFNFRFCPESDSSSLKSRLTAVLDRHGLEYDVSWSLAGEPFLTEPAELVRALCRAIEQETGLKPELSTSGGTSDGRFIKDICAQVVEFGPVNKTIHQVDEQIPVADIETLTSIYQSALANLLSRVS